MKTKKKESRCISHAKRELKLLGYKLGQKKEDPNKWVVENLLELLSVFSKQGHSGFSAPYTAEIFKKLALFEPLSPITCKDNEWNEVGEKVFQNNRCSAVFKDGKKGRPYYLDAIVWKSQKDCTYTGTVEGIKSRQFIKLPFIPKTFYIDTVESDGPTIIKDKNQLIPVFKYYRNQLLRKWKGKP